MKVLIVEDDRNKLANISGFLRQNIPELILSESYSYQSGLKNIRKEQFDFLILDMSLPNYDINAEESGFKFRHFAGSELLDEMNRYGYIVPTFIVTQFDTFGEGTSQKTLAEIDNELIIKFPNQYFGIIFYSASEEAWKAKLLDSVLKYCKS
ncbi:response regulator [Termitidicoccus mucosus]|uniref:hypothetical protein n=1 Tax=Termitidicoccus mucosus TaxID=1184151 RepID=UPI003182C2CA